MTKIGNQPPITTNTNASSVTSNFKVNNKMNVPLFNGVQNTTNNHIGFGFEKASTPQFEALLNNFSGLSDKDIDATFKKQGNLDPSMITEDAVATTNRYWTDERTLV